MEDPPRKQEDTIVRDPPQCPPHWRVFQRSPVGASTKARHLFNPFVGCKCMMISLRIRHRDLSSARSINSPIRETCRSGSHLCAILVARYFARRHCRRSPHSVRDALSPSEIASQLGKYAMTSYFLSPAVPTPDLRFSVPANEIPPLPS